MWFSTEEAAKKDAERKSVEWGGEEFIVIKDKEKPDCWWTQRKSALDDR